MTFNNEKFLDLLYESNDSGIFKKFKITEENYLDYVNSPYYKTRLMIAKQGFALDKFINDANAKIRVEVAKGGVGLSKLVEDKDFEVRLEVARVKSLLFLMSL